jgi:GTP cyclohydrolase II
MLSNGHLTSGQARCCVRHEPPPNELRDYDVGAQILFDLRVRRVTMISNSQISIVGVADFGLPVVGTKSGPIDVRPFSGRSIA